MNIKILVIQTYAISLLVILTLTFANASQASKNHLLEFSLDIGNDKINLSFPSNTYETKSEKLGINWYEPFTPYFHGGLELGYLNLTQLDSSLASARYTSGEYLGLLLRYLPVTSDIFSLALNANYRFNSTLGTSTNQESKFTWYETRVSADLTLQATSLIAVSAATEYQLIDGSQHDNGTINQISNFNSAKNLGYRLGINIDTDRTGVVGFEWFTGFRSGTRLYFTRKF